MTEGESTPEVPRPEGVWTSQDLRYYLLALAHNSPDQDYCLELGDFPRQMVLSAIWHETFGRMRTETARHHREYWSVLGATLQRDRLIIPRESVAGAESLVNRELITAQLERWNHGLAYPVADIHSHPARWGEKLIGNQDAFSLGDLYGLLYSREALAARFLVGPARNLAVFRSRESELLPPHFDQQHFEEYWEHRHCVRLGLGDSPGLNLAVGKRHYLAFYRGLPGQPMVRIMP